MLGIQKLYEGEIIMNENLAINEKNIHILRNQCAYLPQDNFIFDGTIKENITFKLSITTWAEHKTDQNSINKFKI